MEVVEGRAAGEAVAWNVASRSLEVKAETEAVLEVRLHYFPGWTARLDDGRQLELRPAERDGLMRLRVPAGDIGMELRVREDGAAMARRGPRAWRVCWCWSGCGGGAGGERERRDGSRTNGSSVIGIVSRP